MTEPTKNPTDADCACSCSPTGRNGGGSEKARQDLANDINPADARRNANLPERMFGAVARHWLGKLAKKVRLGKRSVKTLKKATWALEAYVFPSIGAKHIGSIEPHQHPHLRSTQRTQTAESDAQNGAATLSQPQGRRHDSVSRATPP